MSVLTNPISLKNNFIKKIIKSICCILQYKGCLKKRKPNAFEFSLFCFGTHSNKQ